MPIRTHMCTQVKLVSMAARQSCLATYSWAARATGAQPEYRSYRALATSTGTQCERAWTSQLDLRWFSSKRYIS